MFEWKLETICLEEEVFGEGYKDTNMSSPFRNHQSTVFQDH